MLTCMRRGEVRSHVRDEDGAMLIHTQWGAGTLTRVQQGDMLTCTLGGAVRSHVRDGWGGTLTRIHATFRRLRERSRGPS